MLKYFMLKKNLNLSSGILFRKFEILKWINNSFLTINKNKPLQISTHSNQNSNLLINYQKFYMRSMKTKRRYRKPDTGYKIRTHHGLSKRIRIVGPRWNRCFKFWPTGHTHKMTNKLTNNLRSKKKAKFIKKADLRHVKRMLPYYKRKKYKH
jgi:ribosomal protein L35